MKKERGQSAVVLAILALVVGIVAFIGIYGMNSHQNMELANSVAHSIDASSPEIGDTYMESIEHSVKRHGPVVYSVVKYCNSKGFFPTVFLSQRPEKKIPQIGANNNLMRLTPFVLPRFDDRLV